MKLISEEQVAALLNYLITRPYAEVFRGIEMLESLPSERHSDADKVTSLGDNE